MLLFHADNESAGESGGRNKQPRTADCDGDLTDEQNTDPPSTAADRGGRVSAWGGGVRGEKTGVGHGGDEATRGESVTLFQVKELT